jgi:type II secretory pathway component GspD/PulD (secretin)
MTMTDEDSVLEGYEDVSEYEETSYAEEETSPPTRSSKITLELKGVDILDVLKVLSKKSGLNIVAGKNVRGQVTLFLQDVDVWDALKIVLETSDLAYEKKGDIIKVITESDYEARYGRPYETQTITEIIQLKEAKVQTASEMLNQMKSTVGRIIVDESTNSMIIIDTPEALDAMRKAVKNIDVAMQTHVFHLKYAKSDEIEAKLSEMITPNVGDLKVDSRTNKVIVTDIASKISQIQRMIQVFDEKPLQVLIDAKIIEVVLEDEYALGIDWDLVFSGTNSNSFNYASNSIGGIDIPSTSGPLAGLEGSDLAMFTINSTEDDFNAVITALEAMGKANTLSNPRVAVLNNEEAAIAVATRQPFVSQTVVQGDSTSTTADNVEFVDVGVTLSVVPTITMDNYILMEVKPEVSSAGTPLTLTSTDSNGQQFTRTVVPVVTSQEVETKVLVKSGTTLVLGGLIQDSQSVQQKKVPFFGDIPFVGSAFRSKSDDFKKTELVIFITPHILAPDISTDETTEYLLEDGSFMPFNKVGGADSDYYDASYTSQSFLHTDDNSFWEEFNMPSSNFDDGTDSEKGAYIIDRQYELKRALDSVTYNKPKTTGPALLTNRTGLVPLGQTASAPNQPVNNVNPKYLRTIKKSMFEAIIAEQTLKELTGEVKIDVSVAQNGYLRRLRARSVENPKLNGLLILAINNNAPYPSLPQTGDTEDQNLSFSLFF